MFCFFWRWDGLVSSSGEGRTPPDKGPAPPSEVPRKGSFTCGEEDSIWLLDGITLEKRPLSGATERRGALRRPSTQPASPRILRFDCLRIMNRLLIPQVAIFGSSPSVTQDGPGRLSPRRQLHLRWENLRRKGGVGGGGHPPARREQIEIRDYHEGERLSPKGDRESLERGLDENEAAGAGGLTGRDRGESKAE